jgi:hypothetical protein
MCYSWLELLIAFAVCAVAGALVWSLIRGEAP